MRSWAGPAAPPQGSLSFPQPSEGCLPPWRMGASRVLGILPQFPGTARCGCAQQAAREEEEEVREK